MDREPEGCLICHSPLVYGDTVEMRCTVCGRTSLSNARCAMGHFICDSCHRSGSAPTVRDICLKSTERDPAVIAIRCMSIPEVHMHGPEHHVIVGSALLSACRNAGADIDLPSALDEMARRGSQIPGGICGNWGDCGAAVSCGMACSILLHASPLSGKEWGFCNITTGQCLIAIGELGGPRCCKRDTFTALKAASTKLREELGIDVRVSEDTVCGFHSRNAQCKGADCPYHPVS